MVMKKEKNILNSTQNDRKQLKTHSKPTQHISTAVFFLFLLQVLSRKKKETCRFSLFQTISILFLPPPSNHGLVCAVGLPGGPGPLAFEVRERSDLVGSLSGTTLGRHTVCSVQSSTVLHRQTDRQTYRYRQTGMCLYVCLEICLYAVCLYVGLYVCMSVCLPVCLSEVVLYWTLT